MYQYLFGNTEGLPVYDLIGILGYLVIIGITFSRKNILARSQSLGTLAVHLKNRCDAADISPKKRAKLSDNCFWARKEITILFLVHVITYTFAGELFGNLIGRRTDFFGYVVGTNIAMCITCYILGIDVLQELDNLCFIYLSIASLLKLGCFCAGCCNGLEWEFGLYNHSTERYEFPVQLVECLVYFTFLILLKRYKKKIKTGFIAPLFLILYFSFRFLIQFFRADEEVFSLFHYIPLFGMILGFIHLLIVYKYRHRIINGFKREVRIGYIEKNSKM